MQLIEAKSSGNRRDAYVRGLHGYLKRFAKGREGKLISDFTTLDIQTWLKQFHSLSSKDTNFKRIAVLFAFALRHEMIFKDPCLKIEPIFLDKKAPFILSPEQTEKLLEIAQTPNDDPRLDSETPCLPYIILGLFAGIRPDELLRLQWEDVSLKTRTVAVDGKTRRRRIVPLEPRAVALLSACVEDDGPVSPSNSTVRRFKRAARLKFGWSAFIERFLCST
jgi:site-specific recombinase XerD